MQHIFLTKKRDRVPATSKKKNILQLKKTIKEKLYRTTLLVGVIGCSLLFILSGIVFLLKATIYADSQIIYSVSFSQASRQTYYDPILYRSIQQYFRNHTKLSQRLGGCNRVTRLLQPSYPMLAAISLVDASKPSHIEVDLVFKEPLFVVSYDTKRRGVWSDVYIYPLFSGQKLGSEVHEVWMPSYITGALSLSGMFSAIAAQTIASQLETIVSMVPNLIKVVYLIGGEKMALVLPEGKKVYINNKKDIKQQLHMLLILQKDRLIAYSGLSYENIGEIDLGSLEYPVIKTR